MNDANLFRDFKEKFRKIVRYNSFLVRWTQEEETGRNKAQEQADEVVSIVESSPGGRAAEYHW